MNEGFIIECLCGEKKFYGVIEDKKIILKCSFCLRRYVINSIDIKQED